MNDQITRLALDEALATNEYFRQRLLEATLVSDSLHIELPSESLLWDMEQVACDVDASEDELRELAFDLIRCMKKAADTAKHLNSILNAKGV